MNKRMLLLLLSLLFVVALSKVEFSRANESSEVSQEMIDKSLILRKKAENTPEYQALMKFRQETDEIADELRMYERRCEEIATKGTNISWINYLASRVSRDSKKSWLMATELRYRKLQDGNLAQKAVSTSEYSEWVHGPSVSRERK